MPGISLLHLMPWMLQHALARDSMHAGALLLLPMLETLMNYNHKTLSLNLICPSSLASSLTKSSSLKNPSSLTNPFSPHKSLQPSQLPRLLKPNHKSLNPDHFSDPRSARRPLLLWRLDPVPLEARPGSSSSSTTRSLRRQQRQRPKAEELGAWLRAVGGSRLWWRRRIVLPPPPWSRQSPSTGHLLGGALTVSAVQRQHRHHGAQVEQRLPRHHGAQVDG